MPGGRRHPLGPLAQDGGMEAEERIRIRHRRIAAKGEQRAVVQQAAEIVHLGAARTQEEIGRVHIVRGVDRLHAGGDAQPRQAGQVLRRR